VVTGCAFQPCIRAFGEAYGPFELREAGRPIGGMADVILDERDAGDVAKWTSISLS
jgi:hypothetical protein